MESKIFLWNVVICALVCRCAFGFRQQVFQKSPVVSGQPGDLVELGVAQTELICARNCFRRIGCKEFTFDEVTKKCGLYRCGGAIVPQTMGSDVSETYGTCHGPDCYVDGCKCIVVSSTNRTWHETVDFCRGMGSRLAVVDSADTLDTLRGILSEHYPSIRGFFVDGTDEQIEDTWVLWDGTTLTWTEWYGVQPNNYNNQDCLMIMRDEDYRMGDGGCHEIWPGICEV